MVQREKEKDSRYMDETSAPAAAAVYQIFHIMYMYMCNNRCYDIEVGETVCVYSMVQRREKRKDSRYMDETSAPAAVTVYQICNISPAQDPVTTGPTYKPSDGSMMRVTAR